MASTNTGNTVSITVLLALTVYSCIFYNMLKNSKLPNCFSLFLQQQQYRQAYSTPFHKEQETPMKFIIKKLYYEVEYKGLGNM